MRVGSIWFGSNSRHAAAAAIQPQVVDGGVAAVAAHRCRRNGVVAVGFEIC